MVIARYLAEHGKYITDLALDQAFPDQKKMQIRGTLHSLKTKGVISYISGRVRLLIPASSLLTKPEPEKTQPETQSAPQETQLETLARVSDAIGQLATQLRTLSDELIGLHEEMLSKSGPSTDQEQLRSALSVLSEALLGKEKT
jgi:hypothetical protein